jgi:hypothetical protein
MSFRGHGIAFSAFFPKRRQSAGIWVTLNIFTVRKLFYFLFVIPCIAITSCSKEDMASTNKNSNLASLSVGVYNPSDPDEILERIEEFLEGVVQEHMEDIPVQEAIWKLEASLNYAFRHSLAPSGQSQIDSLFFDVEVSGDLMSGDALVMVFNDVYDYCLGEIDKRGLNVSFIDVTLLDDQGSIRVTPVYASRIPFPPSIPSIGDWRGNQDGACLDPAGVCGDKETSGHKIAELLVHRYYFNVRTNLNLDPSSAHFHTGIYVAGANASLGEGGTGFIDCPRLNFPVDFEILDDIRSSWELFGCFGSGAILAPNSSDYCVTESEIEDYANILEVRSNTYNPGNNRMLFHFLMGNDFMLNGDNVGYHFPGAFGYGNFVYIQPSHSIHGF